MDDEIEVQEHPPHEDTLYYWCKRYVESVEHWEAHPEDPYGDAELEYCEDNIARLLRVKTEEPENDNRKSSFVEGFLEGRQEP